MSEASDSLRLRSSWCGVKLEAETETDTGFVLMLVNGRRIASGWEFSDAALAKLIRIVEQA
jgi:hypothetical protein